MHTSKIGWALGPVRCWILQQEFLFWRASAFSWRMRLTPIALNSEARDRSSAPFALWPPRPSAASRAKFLLDRFQPFSESAVYRASFSRRDSSRGDLGQYPALKRCDLL